MGLSAHNLSLYVDGTGSRCLCNKLNIEFKAGENWAILGANGSGKTRLLHTLAGLRPADDGEIRLNNININEYKARQRARQIGVLFQDAELFPATVMETVLAGRHPHATDKGWQRYWPLESEQDRQLAMAAMETLDLQDMAERDITSLSGGERRRADIATLLTQNTPICLLDEITNDLDLRHQVQALNLFSKRVENENHLNIFILHDINLALRYCNHALMIFADGEIRTGTLPGCIDTEILVRLYGCEFTASQTTGGEFYFPE